MKILKHTFTRNGFVIGGEYIARNDQNLLNPGHTIRIIGLWDDKVTYIYPYDPIDLMRDREFTRKLEQFSRCVIQE